HRVGGAGLPRGLLRAHARAGARAGAGGRGDRRGRGRGCGEARGERRGSARGRSVRTARPLAAVGARRMESLWTAGERTREAELTLIAPGRGRVRVDQSEFELSSETMPDGKLRLVGDAGVTVAEVTAEGSRRFVRLGVLDFVLERENASRGRG